MLSKSSPYRLLAIGYWLLGVTLVSTPPARADATVTNCTQQDLVTALASGGIVTFDQDCDLTLSTTILITNEVTLDAADHIVSISGDDLIRLFTVEPGASFTLNGMTLLGGQS